MVHAKAKPLLPPLSNVLSACPLKMLRGGGRVRDQEDTNHYIRKETRRGTIATVAERVPPLTPMIAQASVDGEFTIKHNDLRPMGGDVMNVRSRAVTIRTGVLQNSYGGMTIRGGGIKPSGSRQRTSSAVDSLRERRLFNDQGKTLKVRKLKHIIHDLRFEDIAPVWK